VADAAPTAIVSSRRCAESTMGEGLVAFLAISMVVIVTPGQDTALTIRNTLLGGRRAGVSTAIGVAGGQLVWTIAASVGITALLVASEPVFFVVRMAGALYLIVLGALSLWSAIRGTRHDPRPVESMPGPVSLAGRPFRHGLLSNLGNPKMVVFFSSLLPQFAPSDGPTFLAMLGLGLVFCSMTLVWLSGYAWLVARVGSALRRPRVRRALDAITGTVLVAFGVRVAAEPS
jgi:threonine/homoserine/homoserine lactone efflux protein